MVHSDSYLAVLIESCNIVASVQREIRIALDVADEKPDGIVYIPLRLEDCSVPDRLKKWHWVPIKAYDYAAKSFCITLRFAVTHE